MCYTADMKNSFLWLVLIIAFFVVFPEIALVIVVCLAPLSVIALGGAVIGAMISAWIRDVR